MAWISGMCLCVFVEARQGSGLGLDNLHVES